MADWHRLPAILFLRLETLQSTLLKLFEQKLFLSNCSKQLITPVNLTRKNFNLTCLSLTNYLISKIGSVLPQLKAAFYRSHFGHCALIEITKFRLESKCHKGYFLNFPPMRALEILTEIHHLLPFLLLTY